MMAMTLRMLCRWLLNSNPFRYVRAVVLMRVLLLVVMIPQL